MFVAGHRRGDYKSIRRAYEEQFCPNFEQQVSVNRVVNIGQRGLPFGPPECDGDYQDDEWYDDEAWGEGHDEDNYPPFDHRHYEDGPYFYGNSAPPVYDEGPPQPYYGNHDLRHQLNLRKSRRGHSRFKGRGRGQRRGSGPSRREDRKAHKKPVKRDHSPDNGDGQQPGPSGSQARDGSASASTDQQPPNNRPVLKKYKPEAPLSFPPGAPGDERPPRSPESHEEKAPASAAETETEEAAAAGAGPEDDFKASRAEAVKAKALEIEKHYRRDCETFCTVVKMLVAKEPSLNNLLQSSLEKNLLELKQRYLDSLRQFIKRQDRDSEPSDRATTQPEAALSTLPDRASRLSLGD